MSQGLPGRLRIEQRRAMLREEIWLLEEAVLPRHGMSEADVYIVAGRAACSCTGNRRGAVCFLLIGLRLLPLWVSISNAKPEVGGRNGRCRVGY